MSLPQSPFTTFGDLFAETPVTWGLRGDPHLWEAMRVFFADAPVPGTPEALAAQVAAAFQALTGQPISTTENFYVEKYAHGGMSSGHIDPGFWRNRAIPLLQARLGG